MNILFVCTGNINRSPAAQIIYQDLSPLDFVDSAALKGKPGILTTKKMRYALEKIGYNYIDIRSKSVTQDLINWADSVLYFQPSHRKDLQKFGVSHKYKNLASYIGKNKIQDPHFDGSQEKVLKDIEMAIKIYVSNKEYNPLLRINRSLFI